MKTEHNTFHRLLIATAIAGSLGLSAATHADESFSADVTEARKEGQIIGAYALNRHLNPFKIDVDVEGKTATLTGEVEDGVDKDLAEQIALGVDGVDKVDNKIAVNANYKADTNKDSDFGEVVSDSTITASVKSKLLWNQHTDGLDINVDTQDGVVTLTGVADTAAAKELAERLAANTEDVRDVKNDLRVATKSGDGGHGQDGADRAADAVSDTWITSKVKTTFLLSRNISATDISIDTKNGVVTLTGQVDSGAERDLAIEVAEDIRGVKQVKAERLQVNS